MNQQEIRDTFAKRQSLKMLAMYGNLENTIKVGEQIEKSEVIENDFDKIEENSNKLEKSFDTLFEPLIKSEVEEIIEKSQDIEIIESFEENEAEDFQEEVSNELKDDKVEKSEIIAEVGYLDNVENSMLKGEDIYRNNDLSSFQKSQRDKILSMYNIEENDIEKAKPEGSLSPDGKKIKKNGEWVANNTSDLESEKGEKK